MANYDDDSTGGSESEDNSGAVLAVLGAIVGICSCCGCGMIYKTKRDNEMKKIAASVRRQEKQLQKQQSLEMQNSAIRVRLA